MRYVDNPDLLAPIMQSVRNEYLYIDFYDYLRCESEGTFYLLSELLRDGKIPDHWDTTSLSHIINTYSRDELFDLCATYPPMYLMIYLFLDQSYDELCKFYAEYIHGKWISPLAYHRCRYELIVNTLIDTEFVKKIYIGNRKYTEDDLNTLSVFFGDACNTKVIAYEGDYTSALKDHPEITFLMIRDGYELFQAIKKEPSRFTEKESSRLTEEDIKDRYFLLSTSAPNLEFSQDKCKFKNQDIIDTYDKCHIYTTFLYPIPEDDKNTVG